MTTKLKTKSAHFVNIKIGAPDDTKMREMKFSRFQFELFLVLVPVVIIWGLVSTFILIKNLNSPAASTSTAAPAIIAPSQIDVSGATTTAEQPREAPRETQQEARPAGAAITSFNGTKAHAWIKQTFTVDKIFQIRLSVFSKASNGPFTLALSMENQSGTRETGHFWAAVRAIDKTGKELIFSATPAVTLDATGNTKNARNGFYFAVAHRRDHLLVLTGPKTDVVRFTEVIFGIEAGSKGQFVKSIPLTEQ